LEAKTLNRSIILFFIKLRKFEVEKVRGKVFLSCLVVLLFVLSVSVCAESSIKVTNLKNNIAIGEKAKFKLEITNNAEEKQRYSIYSLQSGQGWNVDPYPLRDKIIELLPGKSYSTTIQAEPLETFSPGIYYVQISIASDLGEAYSKSLKIYLSPEKPIDYLPSIKATIDMDEKINPKEAVSIKMFLENKNPLDLSDLKIKIQSEMPEFVKELSVNLPPLEKKTVEFTISPNKYQQPKDYTLFFVFEKNGEVAKIIEQKVEILSLLPDFKTEVKGETIVLKTFNELIATNEGNVLNTQTVKHPISLWKSLITISNGKTQKIEGERYLTWEATLSPNESVALNFTTNYRILLYVLIVLIVGASFYFYVQSPLVISKEAITTRDGEDQDTLSEIKITLEVKNKTTKPIKEINITDLVPGIANVEKSLELGTLRPKEVRHTKQGTKVIWSLAELDAHEHRLITYKVKAKLNIVGTFSLPRAIVDYKKGKKKIKKSYSNIFRLSS
jgi:hypothetical protein